MRLSFSTLVYHAALLLHISITQATEELTKATFSETINSGKNGMVKFYQSWCGHCIQMKPDWDKLATNAHSSVFIKDVNCGDQQDLCEEHGVTGYPTIKYFIDGKEHDFNEGRSYEALVGFVDSHLVKKCDIKDAENTCSEKEQKYIKKWADKEEADISKEQARLKGMQSSEMSIELKSWLNNRMHILTSLLGGDESESSSSVTQTIYDTLMDTSDFIMEKSKPYLDLIEETSEPYLNLIKEKSEPLLNYFSKDSEL